MGQEPAAPLVTASDGRTDVAGSSREQAAHGVRSVHHAQGGRKRTGLPAAMASQAYKTRDLLKGRSTRGGARVQRLRHLALDDPARGNAHDQGCAGRERAQLDLGVSSRSPRFYAPKPLEFDRVAPSGVQSRASDYVKRWLDPLNFAPHHSNAA